MRGFHGASLNFVRRLSYRHIRKAPLSKSKEAQRQLTMGWQLDPEHMEAPKVPILESLFDDKDIYTKSGDSFVSHRWSFVTPQSPLAESPSEIKGANAIFVQSLFQGHRLLRHCKCRLEVPDVMTLLYFPPWHPLAQGRKSRPALTIVTMHGAPYNGNTPALKVKQHVSQKSRNPLDYAVWRQRTARRMRRMLFENWHRTRGFRDGLYVGLTRRMPTEEQARTAFSEFLEKVASSNHEWADKQRGSMNLEAINKRLAAANMAPVSEYLNRHDWE